MAIAHQGTLFGGGASFIYFDTENKEGRMMFEIADVIGGHSEEMMNSFESVAIHLDGRDPAREVVL